MSAMELMLTPGHVDPELAKILENGAPPGSLSETTDVHALRETLRQRKLAAAAAAGAADTDLTEADHQIRTRDGSEITVRVYHGSKPQRGPVMVMLHGGGWVLGGLENEAHLCREWCKQFDGVCVNVDYRLAPEFKFPTALNDCYDAVKWTAASSDIHGGDLAKGFIVAGISAGANMACTISHLARDDRLSPRITGVYLSIPSILSPEAVPDKWKSEYKSRDENADALVLNSGAIAFFRKNYQDDPTSPLMSPVVFPSHKNIPPTYLQVAGGDPLRDDGLIYERILREEVGVATKLDLYPGLPHGFWSWWPEAEFSLKHRRDSISGLGWLLKESQ